MRIECTQGCGALLDVEIPPAPHPSAGEPDFEAWRAEHEQTVGRAVLGTLIAHMLLDCPIAAENDADCGHMSPMGYKCNRQKGHPDAHEHQVDDPETESEIRVVASWPALQVVQ